MTSKTLLAALGALLVAMICTAPAFAREGPAIPIPMTPGADEPEFIGKRAIPKPIDFAPPPEHPFMATNGESNLHVDAYASDVNEWIGPLGGEMTQTSNMQTADCASVTFDSEGRIVTICVGLESVRLALMDPQSLEILAEMQLPARQFSANPFTEFGGGGYFYLDDQDRAVIPTADRQIIIVETIDGPGGPAFNQVASYDLNPALADDDVIVSALPDFSGNVWFAARSGVVGFVDPADGSLHSRQLPGEGITNSFAIDEDGGVYIVTDRAMYRFEVGAGGEPTAIWRQVYPNNGATKPGQVDDGSGTTPTLMGEKLVAINDNSDPMGVIVYRRDRNVSGSRQVCSQSVFPAGQSATDNSLIATSESIVVENNYGYEGPTTTQAGGQTAPGIARIDLDDSPNGCSIVWESEVNSPTVVPKLSAANGLVYVYAKEDEASDPWYLTAIDFRSGETVYQRLSGAGLGYNNNYAPITIGPDGSIYVGVLGGIVRLTDVEPPSVNGGGDQPSGEPGSCETPTFGTDDHDRFVGSQSADGYIGGGGGDTINGRGGDDCLGGGGGADKVAGGGGADTINGGNGIDDLRGGSARDRMIGDGGGDTMRGGAGGDFLFGRDGRDVVRGGGGNDRIKPGKRSDRVRGGAGDDNLDVRDGERDNVNCGTGRDKVSADPQDRIRPNCERVRLR